MLIDKFYRPYCQLIDTPASKNKRAERESIGFGDRGEAKIQKIGGKSMSKIDDINRKILAGLSGQDKEDFKRGLRNLGMANPADKDDLIAAFKRAGLSDKEAEIAAAGEAPPEKTGWF